MSKVNIKLKNTNAHKTAILINGKSVKFKKNEYGNLIYKAETDQDELKIHIYKGLELNSRIWWLMAFVFYLISIFGIFNGGYDRKCVCVDCKFTAKLKPEENNIILTFNNAVKDGKAVEIESDCEVTEEVNDIYVDEKAKKKRKFLVAMKILSYVAIIIALVFIIRAGWLNGFFKSFLEL